MIAAPEAIYVNTGIDTSWPIGASSMAAAVKLSANCDGRLPSERLPKFLALLYSGLWLGENSVGTGS